MSLTWRELLDSATHRLTEAGVASPRVDAEWLAAHVARVSRSRLLLLDAPRPQQVDSFRRLVARRAEREPLQHVLGTAAFWRSELAVGPGVFVPRPETELLVEWALRELSTVAEPVVVDLCAGSGAIASGILDDLPRARVYAVEKHPEALDWLRRNLADRPAGVVAGDATSPSVLAELDGGCDAVLSNPPYVPIGVAVSPEVAADPHTALYGGADGLDVIRPLLPRAFVLLRPGGIVAVEHDDSHGKSVPELLRDSGFTDVEAHLDLTGRPRFATARKP